MSPQAMARMMKFAGYATGCIARVKAVTQWVSKNKVKAASVAVILAAVSVTYAMRWWRSPRAAAVRAARIFTSGDVDGVLTDVDVDGDAAAEEEEEARGVSASW